MTPIADMVELMFADGATPSLIVLAIRSVETIALRERDGVTHASRDASRTVTVFSQTPGAIRARRSRAKHKQNQGGAKANDVAQDPKPTRDDERDASRDGVTDRCDLSSTSSSVKVVVEEEVKEKKKEAVTKSARGTRMTADAQISPEDLQFAIDAGMKRDAALALWVEFVDFWITVPGQRGLKLNWSATWRNRVRAVGAKGGPNGPRPNHPARRSGADDFFAGLAEVAADIDRDRAVARPTDADIPRGRFEFDAEPTRRN